MIKKVKKIDKEVNIIFYKLQLLYDKLNHFKPLDETLIILYKNINKHKRHAKNGEIKDFFDILETLKNLKIYINKFIVVSENFTMLKIKYNLKNEIDILIRLIKTKSF